jgi:hypothetical protein
MSNRDTWGPPLWRLLHTLAEKLGKHTNSLLMTDERRAWISFLKAVEMAIPCPKCKAHYIKWRTVHKFEEFMTCPPASFREEARKWVWALHTQVNEERGVPNIDLLEVASMYENRSQQDLLKDSVDCIAAFKTAVQYTPLPVEALRNFKTAFTKLRGTLG